MPSKPPWGPAHALNVVSWAAARDGGHFPADKRRAAKRTFLDAPLPPAPTRFSTFWHKINPLIVCDLLSKTLFG